MSPHILIERECCLLVLNSVTSTPQWILQPEAAWGVWPGSRPDCPCPVPDCSGQPPSDQSGFSSPLRNRIFSSDSTRKRLLSVASPDEIIPLDRVVQGLSSKSRGNHPFSGFGVTIGCILQILFMFWGPRTVAVGQTAILCVRHLGSQALLFAPQQRVHAPHLPSSLRTPLYTSNMTT